MSEARPRLIVAGGGIGGLAAAIAAGQAGWDVEVLERAESFEPIGAGLSLWPNGVRALRCLGAADWIDSGHALSGDGGIRRATDGSPIASTSPQAIQERYGEPLALVHRADLLEALLDRLGREKVRFGAGVQSASPHGTATLQSGEELSGDAIVGADGIDSAVRHAVLRDERARFAGMVAYRAVVDWSDEVPAGEYWGRGEVFGLVPLSDGRLYWYASFRDVPHQGGSPRGQLGSLQERYGGWAEPIPSVLRATPPDALLFHPLERRTPVKRWGEGRVSLLGDAAHPMLPFLGQGACCALEDAVALGESLGSQSDAEAALRDYERRRAKRATALVKGSASAARVALASGSMAALRDAVVGAVPERMRMRQLDRVIGSPEG